MSVNHLQAGISNLRVSGVLRVELQPLMGTMPLVGAASVAFIKDPVRCLFVFLHTYPLVTGGSSSGAYVLDG